MLYPLDWRWLATAVALSATMSCGCQGSGQARRGNAVAGPEISGPQLGGAYVQSAAAAGSSTPAGLPQRTCPVTGANLGSMGEPVPVTVHGETVLVCCPRCVKKVQHNPDKYLARVRAEVTGRR
jgi:hypothetical protein